jgi:hypothetical protein
VFAALFIAHIACATRFWIEIAFVIQCFRFIARSISIQGFMIIAASAPAQSSAEASK